MKLKKMQKKDWIIILLIVTNILSFYKMNKTQGELERNDLIEHKRSFVESCVKSEVGSDELCGKGYEIQYRDADSVRESTDNAKKEKDEK